MEAVQGLNKKKKSEFEYNPRKWVVKIEFTYSIIKFISFGFDEVEE